MKKRTLLFAGLFALMFTAACDSEQLTSTQTQSEVKVAARDGDVITKPEDFEEVFNEALGVIDDGSSYVSVKPADGGYIIQVVTGNPAAKQRVCCGSGVSFAHCVQGYVDGGKTVSVSKCGTDTCGKYCGYID